MLRLLPLALLFGLIAAGPAAALESAPATSSRDTATLVSDTDAVAPGTPFRVGLHLHLAPGWHTYWRNPGDAGVAPELNLVLPPGATSGPIAWPTPSRVAEGPVMTYAYTGDLLLPVTVTPAGQAEAAQEVRQDSDVQAGGDVVQGYQMWGQQRGDHQRQDGILRAADGIGADQRVATTDHQGSAGVGAPPHGAAGSDDVSFE